MIRKNLAANPMFALELPAPGLNPLNTKVAALLAALVSPVLVIALLAPSPMILPVFSIMALVAAAAIGVLAWYVGAPGQSDRLTIWDVSGVCLFLGFAAGMLSDPMQVVQFFDMGTSAR